MIPPDDEGGPPATLPPSKPQASGSGAPPSARLGTGTFTIEGRAAPGLFVELRAEMDVLVLVSNCPQINNPCNGFDPTPVRAVVTATG